MKDFAFRNVMLCSLTVHVIPKFHPFHSISNHFLDKFKLRFLKLSKIFEIFIFFWGKFSKCSKMWCCHHRQSMWSQHFVHFVLSLTVWDKCKVMFFLIFQTILNFRNVQNCYAMFIDHTYVPNFALSPTCSEISA